MLWLVHFLSSLIMLASFMYYSVHYSHTGTTVHYERAGNMESVTPQGPLKEPLHVMVGYF